MLWLFALGVGWATPVGAQPAMASAARSQDLAIEAFFNRPVIESARLSPSGRWLAALTALGATRVGLAIFDMQTMRPFGIAAQFADADIGEVHWVNDELLVFDIQDNQSGGSDQRFWPGLFSVARDGKGGIRQLVSTNSSRITERRLASSPPLAVNHTLLHVPGGEGREVIVGEWIDEGPAQARSLNAKRLDVTNGRTSNLSSGAPPKARRWMFDAKGEPMLVFTRHDGRGAYHWRDRSTGVWKKLDEFAVYDAPWVPRFVDEQGQLFVTVSSGRDGVAELKRFDFATGRPAIDALVATPGFDFLGGIVSESPGSQALGVRVTTDAETTVWFDSRLQALQKMVDERMPGHVNTIDCRRCLGDDAVALVYSWSDRDPGQYHIYKAADRSWLKLGDLRANLPPRLMGSTDFERVRMRDALEIPVWVTQPAGKAEGPRPAVVLVHGGPWVRGRDWRWNAQAQFLASRGYVVIEPEFRGSRGYGENLYRAGWRQFGLAMQDDLQDALKWAVSKGWVDPDRVCIAGASYGGYATLMGLVKHPESYRCGIAWVAVTEPRLMYQWRYISDQPDEIRQVDYPLLIGDPVKDQAQLEANSPLAQAARIKAPVMLAVGLNDRRVPVEHGRRMRSALAEAGNPPEWVSYPDEGHGFFKVDNRIDFMRRMEAFLARHTARR